MIHSSWLPSIASSNGSEQKADNVEVFSEEKHHNRLSGDNHTKIVQYSLIEYPNISIELNQKYSFSLNVCGTIFHFKFLYIKSLHDRSNRQTNEGIVVVIITNAAHIIDVRKIVQSNLYAETKYIELSLIWN